MSSESSPPSSPVAASNRRASVSRQTLSDLFGRSPPAGGGTPPYPGPIATAAANAQAQQRRRTSVTQALASSPTQASYMPMYGKGSQSSLGSGTSAPGSIEESAIEDGDAPGPAPHSASPNSPFTRRVSFGTRALKDARGAIGNGANGDGFDWSEQIKNRAERSASLTQQRPVQTSAPAMTANTRAMSTAVPEQPIKEMPRAPREAKKPDHFQERILKGDFYMD